MSDIEGFLSQTEEEEIVEAIRQAEDSTSGEKLEENIPLDVGHDPSCEFHGIAGPKPL